MKGKFPLKFLDLVMIFLALALTGLSAYRVYAKPRNTTQVVIQGPDRSWVFPLDAEETVTVPGPLGNTIIRIHDNEAWVEDSPCDNKTCVAVGHIGRHGDWAACLPNNVMLMIEGSNDRPNALDRTAW
ncbi:NusG domain II-containing protein [Leadbettera azotonutricia]|uniref:Uncharacterized protein n=1 Tax=Leadbettera azotonutricia (strain ATCC BAA-888 / DSM 13862 / ZAS-9) TaxID=545695 RepID=F5YBV4_LEAAZ|nr:NusG domain II-containing protein [Leadbettera azotonutricia]AEF82166.1 conserved hypothetical protein [Leadbettera azotonutricia ZAS-9]